MNKSKHSKNEKVNVGWQTLFSIIPFVSWWTAYRIGKLRKFLLISLPLYIAFNVLFSYLTTFFYLIVLIPLVVYFMRKWSIQWNEESDDKTYIKHE